MHHKFTNRLINESSPYLLQHAHNPVDWFAWGDEALQKAKTENKIILVSIGYAACHWCHVMEKESFENEGVAEMMNSYFVNIKIDREERPDLDHIYMDAVQAISGSGGWPLNVFLTPETKPFYGGTYFPPVQAYNRSSWTEVITAISKAWKERPHEIKAQADNLLAHLNQAGNFSQLQTNDSAVFFTKEQCKLAAENILKQADTTWGGFGKAPKFPQTLTIQYLLQYHHYTGNKATLDQALLSLDKMLAGGIYDHVGGGFARYSTDAEWLAPHFEKMLYDNALLINVICDAYQISRNKKYEVAIRQTIQFLQREMMDAGGGFYAALDADSEGEEGKFYVWDKSVIDSLLGKDAAVFCEFYNITVEGNWEGKNILRIVKEIDLFATEKNIEKKILETTLQRCLQLLLAERNKRIRPITDDKILLGWNALFITSLCKAAAALNDENYSELAIQIMDFLLKKFRINSTDFELFHTYKNETAKYPAFLDDYAYLIQACIQLQEITSELRYLNTAQQLTQLVIDNFMDEKTGYFFFTNKKQKDVLICKIDLYDGATPSGNSIMAENLSYLSVIFNTSQWYQMAERMIISHATTIVKFPTSFAVWASLILKQTIGFTELVITGNDFDAARAQLLQLYLPGKILQCAGTENVAFPMLSSKKYGSKTHIYRCTQYSCKSPVYNIEQLIEIMAPIYKN